MGVIIALSANTANPGGLAAAAVIAMPIAVLLAGVTEFLILDGVDQFPLLAIGMAPSVLAAALLFTTSQSETGLDRVPGARLLSRDALADESAAATTPRPYLFSSFIAIVSVILLFVLLRTVLPTSDALRRRWYLTVGTSGATRASRRWSLPAPG